MTAETASKKILMSLWEFKLGLQKLAMVVASAGFTVLVILEIVFRYFLFLPLHGIEELATYLALWTYFIGGAYGAYEGSHISASLLEMLVSNDRALRIIDVVVKAISAFIAGWMTVWTSEYLLWSIAHKPHSLELQMPLYFVHAAMAVGLALMTFYFVIDLGSAILRLLGKLSIEPAIEGMPHYEH
jgi:TRAP-type C4-dicarboxylate transport system permease small subunit